MASKLAWIGVWTGSDSSCRSRHILDGLFRIAKGHHGLVHLEQLVVEPGITGRYRHAHREH